MLARVKVGYYIFIMNQGTFTQASMLTNSYDQFARNFLHQMLTSPACSADVIDVFAYCYARCCAAKDPGSHPGEVSICSNKFLANWQLWR